MQIVEYWVHNYHPFRVETVINETNKDTRMGINNAKCVGLCPIKATIVHKQRMVDYMRALDINGQLGGEFVNQYDEYKNELTDLMEKYPEKVI